MTSIRLHTVGYISPFLDFHAIGSQERPTFLSLNEKLRFTCPEILKGIDLALPKEEEAKAFEGQHYAVYFGWDNFYHAMEKEQWSQWKEQLDLERERKAKLKKDEEILQAKVQEARRLEELERYAQYKSVLPFQWETGIKDVLSGLSENSMGDGRSSRTVQHIYLLESFTGQRLRRNKGDFLCTSAKGSNGERYSQQIIEEGRAPTCRACLKIADKFAAKD